MFSFLFKLRTSHCEPSGQTSRTINITKTAFPIVTGSIQELQEQCPAYNVGVLEHCTVWILDKRADEYTDLRQTTDNLGVLLLIFLYHLPPIVVETRYNFRLIVLFLHYLLLFSSESCGLVLWSKLLLAIKNCNVCLSGGYCENEMAWLSWN